jgi:Tripartite tricarboxylate transporter TctB family
MSETPSQAETVNLSTQVRNRRYLQIGTALLVVTAVCGLILLGWFPNVLSFLNVPLEFYRYATEIVGLYSLVFLLIGVIGAPGSPRDYFGGAALVAVALFALEASRDLPGMRGFAFGPGTAPRMFALVLGALGVAVAATGVFTKGPGIDRFYVRGPFFVTLSVVLFAWLVRPLGLVIASFLSIVAAAGATPEARLLETLIWGAVLTAFCVVLFPITLNLPMQLWPNSWDLATILKGLSSIR